MQQGATNGRDGGFRPCGHLDGQIPFTLLRGQAVPDPLVLEGGRSCISCELIYSVDGSVSTDQHTTVLAALFGFDCAIEASLNVQSHHAVQTNQINALLVMRLCGYLKGALTL